MEWLCIMVKKDGEELVGLHAMQTMSQYKPLVKKFEAVQPLESWCIADDYFGTLTMANVIMGKPGYKEAFGEYYKNGTINLATLYQDGEAYDVLYAYYLDKVITPEIRRIKGLIYEWEAKFGTKEDNIARASVKALREKVARLANKKGRK